MKRFIDICRFVLVLFGLMIIGLFLTSLLSAIPGAMGTPSGQWMIFGGQNIIAFMFPAILAWKICFKQPPLDAMNAVRLPKPGITLFAVAAYILCIPALNQIVWWNQQMHLPESLAGLEQKLREMEEFAEAQTEFILNSGDIWQMIINILVIGVLTGIGEEFFFRGGLQKMLVHCRVNRHVAIWVSAFIFSTMHFQFFGFVPRLLLGAWFGYLYMWSGSIWLNSLAHALNNSLVIVFSWLIGRGYLSEDFDMIGVSESGFPLIPAISAAIFAFMVCCNRRLAKTTPSHHL